MSEVMKLKLENLHLRQKVGSMNTMIPNYLHNVLFSTFCFLKKVELPAYSSMKHSHVAHQIRAGKCFYFLQIKRQLRLGGFPSIYATIISQGPKIYLNK